MGSYLSHRYRGALAVRRGVEEDDGDERDEVADVAVAAVEEVDGEVEGSGHVVTRGGESSDVADGREDRRGSRVQANGELLLGHL